MATTPSKSSTSKTKKTTTSNKKKPIAKTSTSKRLSSSITPTTLPKKRRTKGSMKRRQKLILQLLLLILFIVAASYGGYEFIGSRVEPNPYEPLPLGTYYEGASGLEGRELRTFLNTLVSTDVIAVNYGTAREALEIADRDPNNPDNVLTIYSRQSVKGTWDGTTWTREHVWPNSRLGVPRVNNTTKNQGSDLHNLRAIIQSVNSSRSNKVFDTITSSDTYFPGDADKGDVARILFFMVIRYDFLQLTDEILPNDSTTNYTLAGAKMSRFSVLMEWHVSDPVDEFERNRNEVIYGYQNNRNPFIDHPEFASMIFEHADYTPLVYVEVVSYESVLYIEIKQKNYHQIYNI
ncbi:MAG TPA: endonuclease [Bacilli bacterium]|nr:endonuclease [Bacilli bacterium]